MNSFHQWCADCNNCLPIFSRLHLRTHATNIVVVRRSLVWSRSARWRHNSLGCGRRLNAESISPFVPFYYWRAGRRSSCSRSTESSHDCLHAASYRNVISAVIGSGGLILACGPVEVCWTLVSGRTGDAGLTYDDCIPS